MKSGIYKITNIVNNKFYIGSSKNLYKREKQHFTLLKNNKNHCKLLQRAYNKYGKESFKFEILALCPLEYLFKLEQWFVNNFKPHYNISIIDVSVPIGLPKPEIFNTINYKELKRKEALNKLKNNSNFGWKSKIIQKLDDNFNIIEEYSSLKDFSIKHKCSIANVGKALKKKQKCKGFYLQYKK